MSTHADCSLCVFMRMVGDSDVGYRDVCTFSKPTMTCIQHNLFGICQHFKPIAKARRSLLDAEIIELRNRCHVLHAQLCVAKHERKELDPEVERIAAKFRSLGEEKSDDKA